MATIRYLRNNHSNRQEAVYLDGRKILDGSLWETDELINTLLRELHTAGYLTKPLYLEGVESGPHREFGREGPKHPDIDWEKLVNHKYGGWYPDTWSEVEGLGVRSKHIKLNLRQDYLRGQCPEHKWICGYENFHAEGFEPQTEFLTKAEARTWLLAQCKAYPMVLDTNKDSDTHMIMGETNEWFAAYRYVRQGYWRWEKG